MKNSSSVYGLLENSGLDWKIHRRCEKFKFSDKNFIRAFIFSKNVDITSLKSRVTIHTTRRLFLSFPPKKAFVSTIPNRKRLPI